MQVYAPEDMKAIDHCAMTECGVASDVLMENAAHAVADEALRALPGGTGEVWLFCGTGNNGGDGIAAARFLLCAGCHVRCFLVGEQARLSPDAREMARRLRAAGGELEPFVQPDGAPQVIVDALFGFSFHGALFGAALEAARLINRSGAYVIACDLPSGVDPLSGQIASEAVRADCTVTMTAYKPGLLLAPGSEYAGRVVTAQIGIPEQALIREPMAQVADEMLAKRCYPRRKRNSHKGDYGKVLLVCGSVGYTGAAAMAARAALRAGSGLVFLAVPERVYPILAAKLDEAIVFPLPEADGRLSDAALPELLARLDGMDACLLGPGLGRSPAVERLVCGLLAAANCPVLVDADGINALAQHMDILQGVSTQVLLTPHDGELRRLGCQPAPDKRLQAAQSFAREQGVCLLLKGYRTIVTDGRESFINTTGNPGMAVGGSGDVLSGILVSLLGRGIAPVQAAACAAWLHGAAGDLAASRLGEASMLPTDLIEALCEIIKGLE